MFFKKLKRGILIPLLISTTSANVLNIQYNDIQESEVNKNHLRYIIKAKQKMINLEGLKNISLFNRGKKIAQNVYYSDGEYIINDINIKFEKAYRFENNFYLFNCKTVYDGYNYEIAKAIVKENKILLENIRKYKQNSYFHFKKYEITPK